MFSFWNAWDREKEISIYKEIICKLGQDSIMGHDQLMAAMGSGCCGFRQS